MNLKQQFVVWVGAIIIGWLNGATASVYGASTGLIVAVVSFFGSALIMFQLVTKSKHRTV